MRTVRINRRGELGLGERRGGAAAGALTGAWAPPGGAPRRRRRRRGQERSRTEAGRAPADRGLVRGVNLSPYDNGYWLTSYGAGQSLYRVTPEDKIVPWIASSITPDGQEGYTIKLDPRAKFHNGKPIDARQVQTSLERHLEAGSATVPSLKGATWEALDASTLGVRTSAPDPWLPNFLAIAYMPIFDVDEVRRRRLTPEVMNGLAGKGFFSGPFRVTRLTAQALTLDAVPEAWDGAPPPGGGGRPVHQGPPGPPGALKTGEIDLMLYPRRTPCPRSRAPGACPTRPPPAPGRLVVH